MGRSTKSNAFASNGNVKGRQVEPTEVAKPVSTAHAKPGSKAEKKVEVVPATPEKVTAAVARNTKGNEKVHVEKPEDIKPAKLLEEKE